jgi:hypothetical protein
MQVILVLTKQISIGRMLRTLVSIIISAHLVHLPQSSAENITVEKILDLTVFGTCNIYLKRFREDQGSVDLTAQIILVQQKLRLDYALATIDNATREVPMVNPTIGLFEGCVLNIIVAVVPNDERRLSKFMNNNNYTYCSNPFSTYILIPDSYNGKSMVPYPRFSVLLLPVRVFYLLVPTVPIDDVNLYTRPYILVCAHCGESSWDKEMAVNHDLTYISSLNFSSSWLSNDVQILSEFQKSYDITGCEHGPWRNFSEPFGSSKRSICNYWFALMDVLVRGVESNLTLSAKYETEISDNRFTGDLDCRYLSDPQFEDAASAWFLESGSGVLYFCDCNQKSQRQMLKSWFTPFQKPVWLFLMTTYLLLSFTLGAKLQINKRYTNNISAEDYVGQFMTVAGIFLRQERASATCQGLLVLTSFCLGVILSQYENYVTSELVVPPPKLEHTLSSLFIAARSKVIFSGSESHTNPNLVEFKAEIQKWNVKYTKDQLEVNDKLHYNRLPSENGTTLSYFAFYSVVERDLLLRRLSLVNNKCHCYTIKHSFRQRDAHLTFRLFLRNRFASIANILRESGIISFFNEKHRKSSYQLYLWRLRRMLEENKYHSDFFVFEDSKIVMIELGNLYLIFVIYGGMGFLAVCIFVLEQLDALSLCIYCSSFLSSA